MSKMKIAVIDYGAGNLPNVVRALTNVGAQLIVTNDPAVVFPGVGATFDTMENLRHLGVGEAIREVIQAGKPVLGICVGMQVLCDTSEEFGDHQCLGIVRGHVRRLPEGQKVPQIGWNQVSYTDLSREHPLFAGIPDQSDFYFVHSYYCDLVDDQLIAGTTSYGVTFPSVLIKDNLAAVQFHPEKSGRCGLRLLANFVGWAD